MWWPRERLGRQRKIKRGAFPGPALGPSAAAVAGDDPADIGEADAGAFEISGIVQALENSKELFRIGHIETDSVVSHGKHVAPVRRIERAADGDTRRGRFARILHRVVNQ